MKLILTKDDLRKESRDKDFRDVKIVDFPNKVISVIDACDECDFLEKDYNIRKEMKCPL